MLAGVGGTGTQSQLPLLVTVHCPGSTGMLGPLHSWPSGHTKGTLTVQAPPHGTSVHCGVGVACGVPVGCGDGKTHPQFPAASASHSPLRMTNEPSGHGTPGGQVGETAHGPPHGTLEHCGVGVPIGHCRVQTWFAAPHRWSGSHAWSVHSLVDGSKQCPCGTGGGHTGTHVWFDPVHGWVGEQV